MFDPFRNSHAAAKSSCLKHLVLPFCHRLVHQVLGLHFAFRQEKGFQTHLLAKRGGRDLREEQHSDIPKRCSSTHALGMEKFSIHYDGCTATMPLMAQYELRCKRREISKRQDQCLHRGDGEVHGPEPGHRGASDLPKERGGVP